MTGEQMDRAVEVVRQLVELIDRKWLQISWHESDRLVVNDARTFLEEVGGDGTEPA